MSKSQYACARTVGSANTSSHAFGAAVKMLLVGVVAAVALSGVSNPVLAQKLINGKFRTKDIADDYASTTDDLQGSIKKCARKYYIKSLKYAFLKYWGVRNEIREANKSLYREQGQLRGNAAKNAKRLAEIAGDLAHNKEKDRDIDAALKDIEARKKLAQKINGKIPEGSPFAHCGEKRKKEKQAAQRWNALRGFAGLFEIDAGAAFGTMKTVAAGTVGDPGSETALKSSKGTLVGGYVKFDGEIPTPSVWNVPALFGGTTIPVDRVARERAATLPGLSYQFTSRFKFGVEYGNLGGTNTGREPDGGRNVAFTFLTPNPATGATGVNAGNTGQDVSIETRYRTVGAHFVFAQPLAGGTIGADGVWSVSGEVGAKYTYTWNRHTIDQSSLTFPGVSSRSKLTSDGHFFAGMLGLDVMVQKGSLYLSLGGYVAPGFSRNRGTAEQNNLCDVCGNPGDRDFTLNLADENNGFGIRTGVTLDFGAFINRKMLIGIKGRYSFTSKVGGFSNPTSPTQQPARFDTNTAQEWSIGLQFKVVF